MIWHSVAKASNKACFHAVLSNFKPKDKTNAVKESNDTHVLIITIRLSKSEDIPNGSNMGMRQAEEIMTE